MNRIKRRIITITILDDNDNDDNDEEEDAGEDDDWGLIMRIEDEDVRKGRSE